MKLFVIILIALGGCWLVSGAALYLTAKIRPEDKAKIALNMMIVGALLIIAGRIS